MRPEQLSGHTSNVYADNITPHARDEQLFNSMVACHEPGPASQTSGQHGSTISGSRRRATENSGAAFVRNYRVIRRALVSVRAVMIRPPPALRPLGRGSGTSRGASVEDVVRLSISHDASQS